MKNKSFTISAAYKWPNADKKEKTNHSEIAIRHIASMISNKFKKDKKSAIHINYKRLRASAGKTMLDSIVKRIETSMLLFLIYLKSMRTYFWN